MKSMVKWKGAIGPGWEPVVEKAIDAIEDHGGFIMQVKEKFGGLRIYTQGGDREAIDDIIRDAESKTTVMCEDCGNVGTIRNIGGWLKTLCETCYQTLEK